MIIGENLKTFETLFFGEWQNIKRPVSWKSMGSKPIILKCLIAFSYTSKIIKNFEKQSLGITN